MPETEVRRALFCAPYRAAEEGECGQRAGLCGGEDKDRGDDEVTTVLSREHAAHAAAFVTVFIWGITFISTKILLTDFQPIEILFFRFVMAYVVLWLCYPKWLHWAGWKEEGLFIAAGFTGVCLYYLLENIALTYTMASNVGVICCVSPFFTAILAALCIKGEGALRPKFFIGFIVAISGIAFISFNGAALELNPVGDTLAVLASVVWACYSVITKTISRLGYPVLATTRRTFFYGLLWMLPALYLFDFRLGLERFADMAYIVNILFLGLGASALCFVTWNHAVTVLGAVKTSVYIYLVPVVTIAVSAVVLGEPVTVLTVAGTALTLLGLALSEGRLGRAAHDKMEHAHAKSE